MEDQHQEEVGVEASRREETFDGNMVQIDMPTQDMKSSIMTQLAACMGRGRVDMPKLDMPTIRRIEFQSTSADMEMAEEQDLLGMHISEISDEGRVDMPKLDMQRIWGQGLTLLGPSHARSVYIDHSVPVEDMKMAQEQDLLGIDRARKTMKPPQDMKISEKPDEGSLEIQAVGLSDGVQPHGHCHDDLKMLKDAYLSAQGNLRAPASDQEKGLHENDIFQQERPLRSTLLHIAASDGNDECVEAIAQKAPHLLSAKNANGDTALHVAAKAGHFSTLKRLLAAHLRKLPLPYFENPLNEIIVELNNQGNTFFHEALVNRQEGVMRSLLSDEEQFEAAFKELVKRTALLYPNKENKSVLYLAIEGGYKELVKLIVNHQELTELNDYVPVGKSPMLAAILKRDQGFLDIILEKQSKWIHLRDVEGMTPLHYAASIGYLDGVQYLIEKCPSCVGERDKLGFYPIHLASDGGHLEVVKKLLEKHDLNPREILDNGGRNILHLAVENGKFNVVRYILKAANNELKKMINDQDANGNTPLHLAALHCHPKIVHALTWDKRVNFKLVNRKNQTALDVCREFPYENPPLRQRLTWIALKSVEKRFGKPLQSSIKVPPQSRESFWKHKGPKMDPYKDRTNTLLLVSTLIITVTFAAGITLPGGTNSSDPGKGMALMLHHIWFNIFIFCITTSMYGAISVTIILIWAQLGDITLALFALKLAKVPLGVTLTTLSVAFMAGVHLVISDLSWLAVTSLIMASIFVLMILLVYILIWFPSSSSKTLVRYISYYPFLFVASLVERDETSGDGYSSQTSTSSCCTSQRTSHLNRWSCC